MDFGIVTAKVDEIGYITHAENLGFTHRWVTDSQMIRSDCWAVLALAARDTRRMQLGTGVNVPGLRLAPVAASGIATIKPSRPRTLLHQLRHRPHRHAQDFADSAMARL
jgi:5,10-methylenetetrahydromethanopterin reductase